MCRCAKVRCAGVGAYDVLVCQSALSRCVGMPKNVVRVYGWDDVAVCQSPLSGFVDGVMVCQSALCHCAGMPVCRCLCLSVPQCIVPVCGCADVRESAVSCRAFCLV